MVLWEPAILVRVRAASRARPQIGDQLVELDRAASHFNPDKDFSFGRSHEQIESFRIGPMLWAARLEDNVPAEPAALKNEPGGGRELANAFPQEPRRFRRENPVGPLVPAP